MEGFKANPKMKSDIACYKEGGSVYKSRTHKEDPSEAAEDKAMVKKGIRQHESAKHKGEEKTDIKLKQGGRAKKEKGTVKKYKTGGGVDASEKGKPSGDKDKTKKVTAGPKKATTPSAAAGKKKESPKTDNKAAKKTMGATSVGTLPEPEMAPSAAMGMPEDQPLEMMADGGLTPDMGNVSDNERAMLMRAMANKKRRRFGEGTAGMGPIGQQALAGQQNMMPPAAPGMGQAVPPEGMGGGMGQATPSGPMGAAAPMGSTQDLMRGLQAIGQYAAGGRAC